MMLTYVSLRMSTRVAYTCRLLSVGCPYLCFCIHKAKLTISPILDEAAGSGFAKFTEQRATERSGV
jgi:hypothetical protein